MLCGFKLDKMAQEKEMQKGMIFPSKSDKFKLPPIKSGNTNNCG